MKLKKVIINNFRNIEHAEYELGQTNLFVGPNTKGKTNTILAIYWALTGTLLDGTSNDSSLKPLNDKKATVSVELQFEDFTFKKAYAEKWTKNQISGEKTLTGHVTNYWINGVKTPVTSAQKKLLTCLDFNEPSELKNTGFNLFKACINPYYFFTEADWKTLRAFIMKLVGDVSNEEILDSNSEFAKIKGDLILADYDTAKAIKICKKGLDEAKSSIDITTSQIAGLKLVEKPADSVIAEAKAEIARIDSEITTLKGSKKESQCDVLAKQLREAKLALRESKLADAQRANDANKAVNAEIATLQDALSKLFEERNTFNSTQLSTISGRIIDKKMTLQKLDREVSEKQNEVENLRGLYKKEQAWVKPSDIRCPNCGTLLNGNVLSSALSEHKKRLEQIAADGKRERQMLDTLTSQQVSQKAELDNLQVSYQQAKETFEKIDEQIRAKRDEIQKKQMSLISPDDSEETLRDKESVKRLEVALSKCQLEESDNDETMRKAIEDMQAKKAPYQAILDKEAAYRINKRAISDLQTRLVDVEEKQSEITKKISLIKSFTETKLSMLAKRVEQVFGTRMKFQLIQHNIKAGSWDEVCVPTVLDKDTPVANGSGSEQILAGIYFAERVKTKLGLPDLPFIFDECDKLDTMHLATIDTAAQIISTKVDDLGHEDVTLEKR